MRSTLPGLTLPPYIQSRDSRDENYSYPEWVLPWTTMASPELCRAEQISWAGPSLRGSPKDTLRRYAGLRSGAAEFHCFLRNIKLPANV